MEVGNVVLFHKDKSFISRAISFFTKSDWTHAGIIYDITDDKIITAEAQANGFVKVEYNKTAFSNRLLVSTLKLRKTKKSYDKTLIQQTIDSYLGKPYDFLCLLIIAISIITKKKIFYDRSNKLICSEAVARVLYDVSNKLINFENEFDKTYDMITPADLNITKQLVDL